MLVFEAFGYTFEIDAAGTITSQDADAATLRTIVGVAADSEWYSTLPRPHSTFNGIFKHYGPERVQLIEAPELDTSGVTGEVVY